MGLEREGKKSSADLGGKVSLGTEILPCARFGGGESLVAGEDNVQGIVRVVNIVVQYGIEGEVVVVEVVVEEEVVEQEVVEEEVEEEVITKEVGMVNVVGLDEVEFFVEKH